MHDLKGNWVGNISGTNNGDVFVEMLQSNENLSGVTRINDKVFGTTVYNFTGRVNGDEVVMTIKPQEKQKMSSAAVYINNRPVTIQLPTTNFGDVAVEGIIKDDTISGNWTSSIGTGGAFKIMRAEKVVDNEASLSPQQQKRAFVMMQIDMSKPELVDILNTVKRAAKRLDIECFRVDEIEHSEKITDLILEFIDRSKYLICDISSERPNVYYELGYAHGRGRRVILIARQGSNIHFDIKDYNIIFYGNMTELEDRLIKRLQSLQKQK
jgi:nucleoside 2-deoxyribosyltransferase